MTMAVGLLPLELRFFLTWPEARGSPDNELSSREVVRARGQQRRGHWAGISPSPQRHGMSGLLGFFLLLDRKNVFHI